MRHHIASQPDRSGKMHNKFIIIDRDLVVTGSPNLTFAAYNYNVESFVSIRHSFVGRVYLAYYRYIISGKDKYDETQDEYGLVRRGLNIFNSEPRSPIQVCLAPILDIKTFVIGELRPSQSIDISMFLISRASDPSNDIVDNFLEAKRKGASITIKVDGNQYQSTSYMGAALNPLQAVGVEVYTVLKKPEQMRTRTKEISTKPQFHDKLVLIRGHDAKKVFIGSAGFTDNVQDNLNLENMVLIKDSRIYDFLLDHFNTINSARDNLVVTKL